jgi:hypothetical protein
MPVVLDPTVGGATANTYATQAEGVDYALGRPYFELFEAATDDERNRALVRAAQLLDLNVKWHGAPSSEVQALQWPRIGAVGRGGYSITSNIIPIEVKHAQIELANALLSVDITIGDQSTAGIKSVKAGSVAVQFDGSSAAADVLPSTVWLMVAHLGARRTGAMTSRLVRA